MLIQQKLLYWYELNQRILPFRKNNDPYRIWVSEIMLQQTQVDTVIPYYNRFMEQFPTVFDLASAEEDEVYKVWAGLGYYSRARNLLKCAKEIVKVYEGIFPTDYKKVLKLPGIGPYTAGAVLSIAYNLKYPAVDGNVMRVISRIYNIEDDIAIPKTKKVFEEKVKSILPNDVRHFNQSIMELGALICTPKNPKCGNCPVQDQCQANRLNIQHKLPLKTKIIKNNKSYMGVGILNSDQEILLIKNKKGLLSGLWGLPVIEGSNEVDAKKNLLKMIDEDYKVKVKNCNKLGEEKHVFTHKTWKMIVYKIDVDVNDVFYIKEKSGDYEIEKVWLEKDKIKHYAISTAFKKVISKFVEI